ncbi:hypothetical protein KIL84_019293 [Mauremys mutica]|uniref:Uncharacterized protein n=1 Tax=Mauremys mutica TaxID=74926 RepID=A0A9D3XTJ5_9SAUR|nr:hypothetical protein KIL84_019293 [Mauremys mutica]
MRFEDTCWFSRAARSTKIPGRISKGRRLFEQTNQVECNNYQNVYGKTVSGSVQFNILGQSRVFCFFPPVQLETKRLGPNLASIKLNRKASIDLSGILIGAIIVFRIGLADIDMAKRTCIVTLYRIKKS